MDNFLSLTGRLPLGGDGDLVLVHLMDALGNLATFLHGVRLKAMRGPAEAVSPSRMENPAPMGVIDAGAVANALAGGTSARAINLRLRQGRGQFDIKVDAAGPAAESPRRLVDRRLNTEDG